MTSIRVYRVPNLPECVFAPVTNRQFLDPTSRVLPYDRIPGGQLVQVLVGSAPDGEVVHPRSRPLLWGRIRQPAPLGPGLERFTNDDELVRSGPSGRSR